MNQLELSTLTGISTVTLGAWQREGLPYVSTGKANEYDLPAVTRWLAQRLARRTEAVTADGESLEAAKRREQIARADLAEMERGRTSGELCSVAEVRQAVTAIGAEARQALEKTGDKLADRLAAEADPAGCRLLLETELGQVLDDLAASASRVAAQ
jgi:phage terminase Nu1 subunit (DNA packaging protein)